MHSLQFMVSRLNGDNLATGFKSYARLVRKGVAGFIVFGGELETVRSAIAELQGMAARPLVIAADLERGLGQQLRGGTNMPPAAALNEGTRARRELFRGACDQVAREAAYAGINVIFAPVVDVDTNPQNPVIGTRAFGSDPLEAAELGAIMIDCFQSAGIAACAKHFPGHGDTSMDSHIGLPRLDKLIDELEAVEIVPFRAAVRAGVRMVMLGHLSVPALDQERPLVTSSRGALRYLRETLGFRGIVTTDAMDMGAISKPSETAARALEAGVDMLLHPRDPEALALGIESSGRQFNAERLNAFRDSLLPAPTPVRPGLDASLSDDICRNAVRAEGIPGKAGARGVIVLTDDEGVDHTPFTSALQLPHRIVSGEGQDVDGDGLIVAVYSEIRGYKGGTAGYVREFIEKHSSRIAVLVSFGSPHLIGGYDAPKVYAWSAMPEAQRQAARLLLTSEFYS